MGGLLGMECSTTGGQIQQFMCAMQWLRSSIPNFQALIHDLEDVLEGVYIAASKRAKLVVSLLFLA